MKAPPLSKSRTPLSFKGKGILIIAGLCLLMTPHISKATSPKKKLVGTGKTHVFLYAKTWPETYDKGVQLTGPDGHSFLAPINSSKPYKAFKYPITLETVFHYQVKHRLGFVLKYKGTCRFKIKTGDPKKAIQKVRLRFYKNSGDAVRKSTGNALERYSAPSKAQDPVTGEKISCVIERRTKEGKWR